MNTSAEKALAKRSQVLLIQQFAHQETWETLQASLHPARPWAAARGIRALPGAPGPAPSLALRPPARPPGFRTCCRAAEDLRGGSETLCLTKGGRLALATALPFGRSRPRTSGQAGQAGPAPRRGPGCPGHHPEGRRRLRVTEVWASTPRGHEPIPHLLPLGPQTPRSCLAGPLIPGGAQPPLVAQCQAGSRRGAAKTRGDRSPVTHSRREVGEGRPPARSQHCTCADAGAACRPRVLRGVVHRTSGLHFP